MNTRVQGGRFVAIAGLIAVAMVVGCQAGDSGEVRDREQGAATTGEALARASEVTVTYYYLPG